LQVEQQTTDDQPDRQESDISQTDRVQDNETDQQVSVEFDIEDLSDQGSSANAETQLTRSPNTSDNQVTLDGFELQIVPDDYRSDREFSDMYHFKVTGELPEDDKAARTVMLTHDLYTVNDTDQRLYRITIPRAKRERTVKPLQVQLCLPLKYQFYTVEFLHKTLCHPATERLYLTLKERYYCRNLFDLAKSIAGTCSDCQEAKRDYAHINAPLHPHPVSGFMDQWHLDHVNLTRPTPLGHKYLLVCIDAYSGWPEIYPVFTTTSLETAKCLVDLVSRFGIMRKICTDRGTSFCALTFKEMARILGIHHKMTASLNPASDGKAERMISSLKSQLKLVCETDDQIVDKLPLVLLGMRGTVSSVTGVSPYHAIFGRSMPLPIPGCDPDTPRQPSERLRVAEREYLDKVRAQLDDLEQKVKLNIAEDKAEIKRAYDSRFRTQPVNFKLGDMVWLKDRGVKAHSPSVITKRKFVGPYFITAIPPGKENEGVAYFLTHVVTGKRLKHPVPPHRLRFCTTDRTELLAKYPNLSSGNTNTPQPPTQVHDSITQVQRTDKPVRDSDSGTRLLQKNQTITKTNQQLSAPKSATYCQAKSISRQRFAPDGLEFLVKFDDNSLEWVNQSNVSPALKADYLIQKHKRARSRR